MGATLTGNWKCQEACNGERGCRLPTSIAAPIVTAIATATAIAALTLMAARSEVESVHPFAINRSNLIQIYTQYLAIFKVSRKFIKKKTICRK
jgi:hypothetical protein